MEIRTSVPHRGVRYNSPTRQNQCPNQGMRWFSDRQHLVNVKKARPHQRGNMICETDVRNDVGTEIAKHVIWSNWFDQTRGASCQATQ